MKIFSLAAVLTGIVLVSLSVKRRKQHSGLSALPSLLDADRRYAIDDLMNGLD
ncbi:MAG TPA: hypothetical protein VJO14_05680 [Bacteroidota bacterium]|nr:hypothetical protein [Bacteroidota bacterium]